VAALKPLRYHPSYFRSYFHSPNQYHKHHLSFRRMETTSSWPMSARPASVEDQYQSRGRPVHVSGGSCWTPHNHGEAASRPSTNHGESVDQERTVFFFSSLCHGILASAVPVPLKAVADVHPRHHGGASTLVCRSDAAQTPAEPSKCRC
jgi:hypothetical protein